MVYSIFARAFKAHVPCYLKKDSFGTPDVYDVATVRGLESFQDTAGMLATSVVFNSTLESIENARQYGFCKALHFDTLVRSINLV